MTDPSETEHVAPPAPTTDDFEIPDEATIEAVIVRLGDPQLRRAFFSQLTNPNWVDPLAERGAFPQPQVADSAEGGVHHSPWPEGEYLVRVAGLVPQEVLRVLLDVADTDNWFAQAAVIQACATLPPELAVELVKHAASYLNATARPHDPVDLAGAVRNTLELDRWKAVVGLVNAIYSPRELGTHEGPLGVRSEIGAGIENYWFGETLPEVAAAMTDRHGSNGVRSVVAWLEAWQSLSGHYSSETGRDISNVWRPSVAPHPQNNGFEDLGDPLVDAVFESVLQLCRNEGVVGGLRPLINSPQPLLQRVGMEVVATLAKDLDEDKLTEVLDIARKWTENPDYLDYTYRVEYSHLLDALAVALDEPDVERWIEMVKRHDFLPDKAIIGFLAHDDPGSSQVSGEQVGQYRDRCRRDLLASLQSDQLPNKITEYRDELVEKCGEAAAHVEFSSWSESFVGPTSPLSSEELAEMELSDLVDYLRAWEPPEDGVFGPTVEGVGRQLAERVKTDPTTFATEAREFIGLEPTYLRSMLSGLDQALRNDSVEIDWDAVLTVCEYVVDQPRGSEERADFDRDRDFLWSRSAVASLLATAVSSPKLVGEYGNRILSVLETLTSDPQPTPEYEEQYGGTNMDPLTLSLNTIRSVAVRAVVRLFLTNSGPALALPELRERSLELLDQHVGTDKDSSLAVQAVFGEHVGRLISEAPDDWLGERIVSALGSPDTVLSTTDTPGADTVWSVMLATYRPGSWIVDLLQDHLSQRVDAVGTGRSEVVGWKQQRNPAQLLGDWLVTLFVQGFIDGPSNENGLLSRYFQNADAELCSQVLERLGWSLGHSEDVPPELLSRAKELWSWRSSVAHSDDMRARELSGIAAWIRTGHFQSEWWMSELLNAAAITTLGLRIGLGEALAEAAAGGQASQALVAAKSLLTDSSGFGSYELMQHLPTILACALGDEDEEVHSSAASLLDALGRKGHLGLADQVAVAQARL